jgi:hypothetical protein
MQDVPSAALDNLRRALPAAEIVEAAAWYAPLEAAFTPAPAVGGRALQLARDALAHVAAVAVAGPHAVVATIDGHCRGQGAEEVMVAIAPDLAADSRLRRLEGDAALGDRFAVQVTLAYKGCWVRAASSYERSAQAFIEVPACTRARTAVQRAFAATATPGDAATSIGHAADATLDGWFVEGRRGGLPLACLASADHPDDATALPGFFTFSAQLHSASGNFLVAEPVFLS